MKQLLFINGTMGVGKTTISQQLKKQLPRSVFLDGDWCWDASPFVVTEETKAMVLDNITHLLQNFLACKEYEYIIFCWVMHEQEIINEILSRLSLSYDFHIFSLLCSPEVLRQRIEKDIEQGKRKIEVLERSLLRMTAYEKIDSIKIDTTKATQQQIVDTICRYLEKE